MKRRKRSITIDAENEQEYCAAYDEKMRKDGCKVYNKNNSVCEMIKEEGKEDYDMLKPTSDFINTNKEENEDESELGIFNLRNSPLRMSTGRFKKIISEEEGLGLGSGINYKEEDSDEDNILCGKEKKWEEEEEIKDNDEEESLLVKSEENICFDDKKTVVNLLCSYLKNNITSLFDYSRCSLEDTIFFKGKKYKISLSCNCIRDLNMEELMENIVNENDGENTCEKDFENNIEKTENFLNDKSMSTNCTNSSLKEFIVKNKPTDFTIKILVVSNNEQSKRALFYLIIIK